MTWKRIQTLLIFLAAALMLSTLAGDMCRAVAADPAAGAGEPIRFTDNYQSMIFSFVTFALACIAIGHYKLRLMQMRLCLLDTILLVFYQIWIAVWFFRLKDAYTFTLFSVFPIIAAILLLVAIRFILRDEAEFTFRNSARLKGKGRGKTSA